MPTQTNVTVLKYLLQNTGGRLSVMSCVEMTLFLSRDVGPRFSNEETGFLREIFVSTKRPLVPVACTVN